MKTPERILAWPLRVAGAMTATALGAASLAPLADAPLPAQTQAMVRHYHAQSGAFAKAEHTLFALLDGAADTRAVVGFGLAFHRRRHGLSDAGLVPGKPSDSQLIS